MESNTNHTQQYLSYCNKNPLLKESYKLVEVKESKTKNEIDGCILINNILK